MPRETARPRNGGWAHDRQFTSREAAVARNHRAAFRREADRVFQGLAADDVDGAVERAGDGALQTHIVTDRWH
jgi:hypothetical protein